MSRPKKPETAEEYHALLLAFVASLTLCGHMGDVSNDVDDVLGILGVDIEWDEWHELGAALGKMGVATINGTLLSGDDDEDEDV